MTENQYALECIPVLSGILMPEPHVFIPEVPRKSHNDHTDMLCVLPRPGCMFNFEFKTCNQSNHYNQTARTCRITGIPTFGINSRLSETFEIKGPYPYMITGLNTDRQIERLQEIMKIYIDVGIGYYQDTYVSRLYWWGYRKEIMACGKKFTEPDPLDPGLSRIGKASTERITLHELYIRACGNIFQENGNRVMPFGFVYPIIGIGNYAETTARKWYRAAVVKYRN